MLKHYHEGEHTSGYQGIRVDTTVAGERIQRYYEEDEEGLAEADHRRLRERAEQHNKHQRVHGPRKDFQMAVGLSAYIHREVKHNDQGDTVIYVPVFRVSCGGQGNKEFRTKTQGYEGAYRQAVQCYVAQWGLEAYRQVLLDRLPDRSLFTDTLYTRSKKKWRQLTRDTIERQLD